jgi:hypothetical protein
MTRSFPFPASGLFLLILPLLVACGTTQNAYRSSAGYGDAPTGRLVEFNGGDPSRRIVMNASMDLRVKNADSTNMRLAAIAKQHGGYVVSLAERTSMIRVRASALDSAIASTSALGKVLWKSIGGKDVTEEYVDQDLRLDNARKARDRYLELLKQAENVQAALLVEKELERLNGEIELLEGRQMKLRHLSEMATISVDLRRKEKLGPLGCVFVGTWKGVRWLFVRG